MHVVPTLKTNGTQHPITPATRTINTPAILSPRDVSPSARLAWSTCSYTLGTTAAGLWFTGAAGPPLLLLAAGEAMTVTSCCSLASVGSERVTGGAAAVHVDTDMAKAQVSAAVCIAEARGLLPMWAAAYLRMHEHA